MPAPAAPMLAVAGRHQQCSTRPEVVGVGGGGGGGARRAGHPGRDNLFAAAKEAVSVTATATATAKKRTSSPHRSPGVVAAPAAAPAAAAAAAAVGTLATDSPLLGAEQQQPPPQASPVIASSCAGSGIGGGYTKDGNPLRASRKLRPLKGGPAPLARAMPGGMPSCAPGAGAHIAGGPSRGGDLELCGAGHADRKRPPAGPLAPLHHTTKPTIQPTLAAVFDVQHSSDDGDPVHGFITTKSPCGGVSNAAFGADALQGRGAVPLPALPRGRLQALSPVQQPLASPGLPLHQQHHHYHHQLTPSQLHLQLIPGDASCGAGAYPNVGGGAGGHGTLYPAMAIGGTPLMKMPPLERQVRGCPQPQPGGRCGGNGDAVDDGGRGGGVGDDADDDDDDDDAGTTAHTAGAHDGIQEALENTSDVDAGDGAADVDVEEGTGPHATPDAPADADAEPASESSPPRPACGCGTDHGPPPAGTPAAAAAGASAEEGAPPSAPPSRPSLNEADADDSSDAPHDAGGTALDGEAMAQRQCAPPPRAGATAAVDDGDSHLAMLARVAAAGLTRYPFTEPPTVPVNNSTTAAATAAALKPLKLPKPNRSGSISRQNLVNGLIQQLRPSVVHCAGVVPPLAAKGMPNWGKKKRPKVRVHLKDPFRTPAGVDTLDAIPPQTLLARLTPKAAAIPKKVV